MIHSVRENKYFNYLLLTLFCQVYDFLLVTFVKKITQIGFRIPVNNYYCFYEQSKPKELHNVFSTTICIIVVLLTKTNEFLEKGDRRYYNKYCQTR